MHKQACLLTAVLFLTACATDDPEKGAKTGAALGALGGAVVGHQLDDDKGRFIGAAVGAVAGALIGKFMDAQQQTLQEALQQEQQDNVLEIERLDDDSLKLYLQNEVSFEFDSAEVKAGFEPVLEKLAQVLVDYPQTVAHIIGFSDNAGASVYNRLLSERRAQSIAQVFRNQGVDAARIRTEGYGELQPRASNETEAGRQRNRRVEIFVKPIVQGKEQMAYELPRY